MTISIIVEFRHIFQKRFLWLLGEGGGALSSVWKWFFRSPLNTSLSTICKHNLICIRKCIKKCNRITTKKCSALKLILKLAHNELAIILIPQRMQFCILKLQATVCHFTLVCWAIVGSLHAKSYSEDVCCTPYPLWFGWNLAIVRGSNHKKLYFSPFKYQMRFRKYSLLKFSQNQQQKIMLCNEGRLESTVINSTF